MSSKLNEDDDYWNISENKGFDFDGEKASTSSTQRNHDHLLFVDDNVSECSYELPANEIPLSLIISDSDLRMILEEQTMCETPLPKNISSEEEIRILRRQLLDRTHPPPPSITITKILLSKPYSLELYKTLVDKEELLDEAIRSGNGDAILAIILFLVKTLKKSHLNRILQQRPIAVNHYLHYLIIRLQVNEATDLLTMIGKSNEAAILHIHLINQMSNVDVKKTKLKQVFSNFFSGAINAGALNFYSQIIGNYINLVEWQILNQHLFKENVSVLKSLYILSEQFRWSENNNMPSTKNSLNLNPQQFSDLYQISPAQFEWVILNERGRSQAWLDIEQLFEKKSFLKQKTFSINIPMERTILQLHSLSAPAAVLNRFLSHLDNPNRRLVLSRRVNAVRTEIDTLVVLKSKEDLENLRDRLEAGTEEHFYAENALKLLNNTKWKPDGINKLIRN